MDTMTTITAVLLDAEERERQLVQRSNVEQDWIHKLRDALYEADDLFDEVATISRRKELMSGGKMYKKVRIFFSHSNQLAFAFTMSREVKKMRERLDDIVKDHRDFGFLARVSVLERRVIGRKEGSYSFVHVEDVIGRDDDKRVVMDLLIDHSSVQEDVYFVTIVGIGGLGKTTLAQLLYNDVTIKNEFPLRLWVCVSEEYDVNILLHKILKSATNQKHDQLEIDQLWSLVQELIRGKKYLLVLDDVWNEDRNEWLKVRSLFMGGQRGSRIMVTTRSTRVARVVGNGSTYELKGLGENDSWLLFQKMAFENEEQMDVNLVGIGKHIIKKCANVPLAIRVVGSLLYGQGIGTWLSFENTALSKIKQDDKSGIMPVLKLSYHQLTSELKNCFSYCAVFPKGYRIQKDILISLWMANSFIQPVVGDENFEDIGEEHFMTLLQRCFFQDVEKNCLGEIVSCKVHDLMHDVAQQVTESDIMTVSPVQSQIKKDSRHLSLEEIELQSILSSFRKMKHLHTLFMLGQTIQGSISTAETRLLLSKVRYLRVLCLCHTSFRKLPSSIGKLIHLRYLDLSYNDKLQTLPATISELINLQTLKARECDSLMELPRNLSKAVNLRCLDTLYCYGLRHMPPSLSKLSCLQKLSRFVARYDLIEPACESKLEDLGALTNLNGDLRIVVNVSATYDAVKFTKAKYIKGLKHLKRIEIFFGPVELVEGLQPHPDLKCLELKRYKDETFPKWESSEDLSKSLPNLVKLFLYRCWSLRNITLLSQLRHLRILELRHLHRLEYIENTSDGESSKGTSSTNDLPSFFPSLEKLFLVDLPQLKEWHRSPLSFNDQEQPLLRAIPYSFPCLSYQEINSCSNLTSIPLCSSLEILVLVVPWWRSPRRANHDDEPFTFLSCKQQTPQQLEIEFYNNENLKSLSVVKELFRSRLSFSLLSLVIRGWSHLKSLCGGGLEQLTSLQKLTLSNLVHLDEFEDTGDDHLPWKSLANLCLLELHNLPKLVYLPKGIQYLTALQSLHIVGCHALISLPEAVKYKL